MTEIPAFTYNEPLGVKVGWMQTGPGPGPGIEFGQALTELANRYEQSDGVVGKSFMAQRAGSQWQGRAAGAADGAVSRAAAAIAVAGRTGKSGGVGSERYGDSFGQAKRAVHVPEKLAGSIDSADPVGSNSTMGEFADGVGDGLNDAFGSTFGIQSDFRARKQAYDEANRAAVEALKAHEARTRAALTTFQAAALPAQSGAAPNGSPGSSVGSARASGARDGVAGGRVGDGGPGGPGGGAPGRAAAGSGLSGGAPSGGAPSGGDPAGVGSPPGGPSTTAAASAGDDGGWTPVPGAAHRSLVPGPGGGWVPAPTHSYPPPPAPLPPASGGSRAGGHADGYPGGGAPGGSRPELAPRSGVQPGESPATGGRPGMGGRAPAGPSGMPPMGLPGGGLGGQGKDHRNQYYIPEDEPFRVEFDDVSPPVVGVSHPEEPER